MQFLKTTAIGGFVFLTPIVVLLVVITRAAGLMMVVAEPMAGLFEVDSVGGIALANLLALAAVILLCFLGGLAARSLSAQKLVDTVESNVLMRVPGYIFVKNITAAFDADKNADLKPVLVSLGSAARIGLEVERVGDNRAAVYFPGSPNAWSGIVQIVPRSEITGLDIPLTAVVEFSEQIGRGTERLLSKQSS